jgi:hypothetical protein
MSFEVFERRLGEKLDSASKSKETFQKGWNALRINLIVPMLKSAEKVFEARLMKATAIEHDAEIYLHVVNRFNGNTHRFRFSPDEKKSQVRFGYVCYLENTNPPEEEEPDVRFFALAELSQLAVEGLMLEFSERVARP